MYLVDKQIVDLVNSGKIKNVLLESIDSVSFDLHINKFMVDDGEVFSKELDPGETVIVECLEEVELPKDLFGTVIQKNSRLRSGLVVNAPVYRPGHNTKIYISVTNNSAHIIELVSEQAIAAMMLNKLEEEPKKTYSGTFQNEVKYKELGNYKNI